MAIEDARAWVEVDLDAVCANYDTVRRAAGGAQLVPMVKADGYGLGAVRVVQAMESRAPWGYGVATAAEGQELRDAGIARPILLICPVAPGDVAPAARAGLTPAISSLAELEAWASAAETLAAAGADPLEFHVDVDTGMGRSGFDWRAVERWGPVVAQASMEALRWSGVFTHFHSGDAGDQDATAVQWERFQDMLVQLPVPRKSLMVHAAASGVAVRWQEYSADAVRPGIFLYGGEPAPGLSGLPAPLPVVSVRARLLLVRAAPAGSTVGYGATHVARSEERWGTVAIGYGDGLPRALGNRGSALVRGWRVPIIGRISMDMTTILLDDVPDAEPGDVVTLVGRDGGEAITLEDVAAEVGTINYEILTGLGPRLPRVVLGNAEESETA